MQSIAFLLSMALALTTTACVGAGNRVSPSNDVQPQEEGQIRFIRNTTYDGRVLSLDVVHQDESTTTLTTARNAVEVGEPVRPAMPAHAGWAWTLVNTAQDSTTYAYAAVSWANDDPTDYLAAGYWMHFPGHPPDPAMAEAAGFIDGPELDVSNPPHLPVQGQATYSGLAGGIYRYKYGDNWGAQLAGTFAVEGYAATVTLSADFSDNTLHGCIGCQGDIAIARSHLHLILGDRLRQLSALPTDYELHLDAVSFNPDDGTFEHPAVTVKHPERTVTQSEGFWGGQFSNLPDADGNPRLVAGFSDAGFEEADGSSGSFWGMFNGLSTSWLAGASAAP